MNAITYFKFKSPYDGDVTKNCALTGPEVDNNFYTLESRDVQSVTVEDSRIVLTLLNGEKLSSESIAQDCLKDLSVDFDEQQGILRITKNGTVQEIGGFVTRHNEKEAIATDGTLVGSGLTKSPSGLSPVYKTGQYRPVKRIIDTTNEETLPSKENVLPGDRYLTIEKVNEYGYLYNYEGLKKIACKLAETSSQWRVPTKDDWDDMLNAVEPNDDFKNHNDARSNKFLGKFAGKLLKSANCWKEEETSEDDTDGLCHCGKDIECHPSYCGEYGSCHHRHKIDNSGIDKYCFSVVPSGYANEAKDFLYFKERAYFWTASNHEYRDAYIKAFAYNKSSVLQDILASDNYLSVRLVKDYNGDNFNERENILGNSYSTVLMPSVKNGQSIWTSVNIGLVDCDCDCDCKYVLPNGGEGMDFITKYFTNEWNGKEWLKKELADGESVVVVNFKKEEGSDDTSSDEDTTPKPCGCHGYSDDSEEGYDAKYIEYRVVKGELVNVAEITYNEVMDKIADEIGGLDDSLAELSERVDELDTKVDSEKTERVAKDTEIEDRINEIAENVQKNESDIATVNSNLVTSVNTINENVANSINTVNANMAAAITTINNAIEAERQIRADKDAELEEKIEDISGGQGDIAGKILTQDGTEYNAESGILMLKSKDGSNDVEVQFDFNFGTF